MADNNKLYRIEVVVHNNLPEIDTMGALLTNEGIAYVKLHPVRIKATQKAVEVVQGLWIPVSERMPETPGEYLVFSKAGNYSVQWFYMSENYRDFLYVENGTITHWMPMPKPPEVPHENL